MESISSAICLTHWFRVIRNSRSKFPAETERHYCFILWHPVFQMRNLKSSWFLPYCNFLFSLGNLVYSSYTWYFTGTFVGILIIVFLALHLVRQILLKWVLKLFFNTGRFFCSSVIFLPVSGSWDLRAPLSLIFSSFLLLYVLCKNKVIDIPAH